MRNSFEDIELFRAGVKFGMDLVELRIDKIMAGQVVPPITEEELNHLILVAWLKHVEEAEVKYA